MACEQTPKQALCTALTIPGQHSNNSASRVLSKYAGQHYVNRQATSDVQTGVLQNGTPEIGRSDSLQNKDFIGSLIETIGKLQQKSAL